MEQVHVADRSAMVALRPTGVAVVRSVPQQQARHCQDRYKRVQKGEVALSPDVNLEVKYHPLS